jgi:threonine dehydratase
MMAKLPKEKLEKGVICSSAGNHAQGVALSARELHCDAVIVMPVTTPEIKVLLAFSYSSSFKGSWMQVFFCVNHNN